MTCKGCQLPESMFQKSYAFIWPPQDHTLYKIAHFLEDKKYHFDNSVIEQFIVVNVKDNVSKFLTQLFGLLTEAESSDTKILLSETEQPAMYEFGNIYPLDRLADRMRGDWLISLLENNQYKSLRQPIVSLDDDSVFGHEYLFRGIDENGNSISPMTLFESAKDPKLFFNLDKTARVSAVKTAATFKEQTKVFINFMPGSVYDPNVCLRTTVNAVLENNLDPNNIVFEIVESQKIDDMTHLRGIVNFYRKAGFQIALDDFGVGFNNIDTLIQLEPDFLKLDKKLTDSLNDPAKQIHIYDIVQRCAKNGIQVIAEGLETYEQTLIMKELKIPLGQGYYYGKPS